MRLGKFITLEGIEGVGKSTQLETVRVYLDGLGLTSVVTREPGGTQLGERVRGLLLDPELPGMASLTELLLMFAARAEHLERVIRPALAAGIHVISDRFHDASYAYQGGGRGRAVDDLQILDRLVVGSTQPDLTLLYDAPVPVALTRAATRRGAPDRFEQERGDFFNRVRAAYLARAAAEPARFRVIDATGDIGSVAVATRAALDELFKG